MEKDRIFKNNHQTHYYEEKEDNEHLFFACQALTEDEKL